MESRLIEHRNSVDSGLLDLRSGVLLLELVLASLVSSLELTGSDRERLSAVCMAFSLVEQYSRDASDSWRYFIDGLQSYF